MIATEAERQFYLAAAGIRLWYARQPLPGAAPSPEFEFPEEAVSPVLEDTGSALPADKRPRQPAQSSDVVTDPVQPGARIADLQALMEKGATGPAKSAKPSVTASSSSEPGPDAEKPVPAPTASSSWSELPAEKVNLRVWAGSRVALIADISAEASDRLQETLALNILKSLGENRPEMLGHVSWPIFNNLLVPGNSGRDLIEVTRSVLSGLERQQVICLTNDRPGQDWLFEPLGQNPAVRFGHSLAELAGNPALKRSLWQELKAMAVR